MYSSDNAIQTKKISIQSSSENSCINFVASESFNRWRFLNRIAQCLYSRVQTPGYIPKKPGGFFLGGPTEKKLPIKPTQKTHLN